MKNQTLKKLILSALFLGLGLVLPFLTGQIRQIGNMLLPMHIPVLLCGLICGWRYGLGVGLILPLLRSALFGMPPLYPIAISMALELGTYGFTVGFLYARARWQCTRTLYASMLTAMVAGRLVWGAAQTVLLGFGKFTFKMFAAGALLNAIPGIILQLVLIPVLMVALHKAKLVPLVKTKDERVYVRK